VFAHKASITCSELFFRAAEKCRKQVACLSARDDGLAIDRLFPLLISAVMGAGRLPDWGQNYIMYLQSACRGKLMKIAICDDNGQDLQGIVKVVEAYRNSRKVDLAYTSYQSASELLDALDSEAFDLVLLDVLMPGITGMQVARSFSRPRQAGGSFQKT